MPITLTPCAGVTITSNDLDVLIAVQGINAQGCVKYRKPEDLVCDGISAMVANGSAAAGVTQLVGSDCKLYTVAPVVPFNLCTALGALAAGTQGVDNVDSYVGADCLTHKLPTIPIKGVKVDGVTIVPDALGIVNLTDNDINSILDSSTVDLTLVGTELTAAVKISTTGANLLTAAADGLSVDCENVQDCVSTLFTGWTTYNDATNRITVAPSTDANNMLSIGSDGKLFVAETPLTVVNSNSVQLTAGVTGQGHTGLTASIRISANAGNQVTVNADGIYVAAATAETPLTTTSSNSITLTAGVTGNGHTGVTASLKVDPAAGNLITTSAAGVAVSCEDIQDCAANLFSTWTNYNDVTNSITIAPSTDAGNQFTLGTDGKPFSKYSFRVTTGANATVPAGGVSVMNGDALHFWSNSGITFSVVAGSAIVQADITVSSNAGNQLSFGSDGKLFVPAAASFVETSLTANNTLSDSIDVTAGATGSGHTGVNAKVVVSPVSANAISVFSGANRGVAVTPCTLGSAINTRTSVTLPAEMLVVKNGCLDKAATADYQVIFGETGGFIQQDARFFFNNDTGSFGASGANPTPSGGNSAVVGGVNGTASGTSSVVIGGSANSAAGSTAAVVGGLSNNSAGDYGIVLGGISNVTATGTNGGSSAIVGGLNNNSGNAEWSLVTGQNNTLTGNGNGSPNRSIVGGFGNSLTGAAGDNIVGGVNNMLQDGAYLNLVAGDNHQVSGFRNLVAGTANNVSGSNGACAIGLGNEVSASGASAIGYGLVSRSAFLNCVGGYNLDLPQLGALSPVGTDYVHVIGNGDNAPSIQRSNAIAVRKDGIQQWWITVDNNNNPNKLPQYPDNASAIAGLAISATTTNLFFGALAMVDVAGVPTWFKYDGTNWLFAF